MRANLYATFRLLAGAKAMELELPPGACVMDAVNAILERYPVLRPHWLDDSGEMHAHVHIILNGADIATLPGGLRSPLAPVDTLDIFPPVAGG